MLDDFFERPLKVLHVDDDEDDFIIMRDLLERISDLSFDLEWVGGYDAALEVLARNEHDLCLLDYHLGAHNGLELMDMAIDGGCEVPFVMLTGTGSRAVDLKAMQTGVNFYLDKNSLNAYDLERAVRYSLEHVRLVRQVEELNDSLETRVTERTELLIQAQDALKEEMRERERAVMELQRLRNERGKQTLQSITDSLRAKVTSELLGIYPLKDSAPDIFTDLVARYELILDQALERRAYIVKNDTVSNELKEMANEMGSLQLSPRDVVEIYNTALKHKSNSVDLPQKTEAYVEEGRLTLLELMGYLASYYRNLVSGRNDFAP